MSIFAASTKGTIAWFERTEAPGSFGFRREIFHNHSCDSEFHLFRKSVDGLLAAACQCELVLVNLRDDCVIVATLDIKTCWDCEFSPSGEHLAMWNCSDKVLVYASSSGWAQVASLSHDEVLQRTLLTVCFERTGHDVLIADAHGGVSTWQIPADGAEWPRTPRRQIKSDTEWTHWGNLQFSSDGAYIFTDSNEGVQLYAVQDDAVVLVSDFAAHEVRNIVSVVGFLTT